MRSTRNQIAIFIPSLTGGGAERVMVALANGFTARGIAVDLVLASANGPYLKDVSASVRVMDFKRGRVLSSILPLANYLKFHQPLAMISAMGHANIVAVCARWISGVPTPLVVTEHANVTRALSETSRLWQYLMPVMMRWTYCHAEYIVTVSSGVADDLATVISVPRDRIQVIYNPVEIARITDLCMVDIDCSSLLEGTVPLILATGRLCPQKDFSTLVKAFALLRKNRKVSLVILGEGELRVDLEAQIDDLGLADCIHLPGFVDNPFAWMRRASLLVLSSAYEGFGLVLVEAMACGTPVVSTDCPSGPSEILEDGRWGALVPVEDVVGMATAMRSSLATNDHPDVTRRAADFDLEAAVNSYLDILKIGA